MIQRDHCPGQGDQGSGRDWVTKSRTNNSEPARQPTLFDDLPYDDVIAGRDHAERNSDDWWMSTAMQAVRSMARTGRVYQAYDLVETYRTPEPDHPNRWGALLTRAARIGVIVPVGAAPSRRPRTAKSLTRTWQGAR